MHPLCKYFQSGENEKKGYVGVECEHFLLSRKDGTPMPWQDVFRLLEKEENEFSSGSYERDHLISLQSPHALMTLEPGSQLEVSLSPVSSISQLETWYLEAMLPFIRELDKEGYDLVYSGGIPSIPVEQIKRIDKQRYYYMDRWFRSLHGRGVEMMRGTASIHVSIDYSSEEDFIRKYRMAAILHPLFAFLMSNTPKYQGEANGDILLRDSIWSETDKMRCGLPSSLFADDFGYQAYALWLEKAPMILMHRVENGSDEYIDTGEMTIAHAGEVFGWGKREMAHYLSMVFPDIRLKKVIEIRSADSAPLPFLSAYAALIKGLFQSENAFDFVLNLTHDLDDIAQAKHALRKDGWDGQVYGQNPAALLDQLFLFAKQQLPLEEHRYIELLQSMTASKKHIFELSATSDLPYELCECPFGEESCFLQASL